MSCERFAAKVPRPTGSNAEKGTKKVSGELGGYDLRGIVWVCWRSG